MDKKLKILHIITRLDVGGSSYNTVETVFRLNKDKYESYLLSGETYDPMGEIVNSLREKNISYKYIRGAACSFFSNKLYQWLFLSNDVGPETKKNRTVSETVTFMGVFLVLAGILGMLDVNAQGNKYVVETINLPDGRVIEATIYPSPPHPPLGIDRTSVSLSELYGIEGKGSRGSHSVNVLSGVPAFTWSFGCSATSAAMIAGYYDRHGYPNMYTGPTNGGVMPLDNSSWPDWTDSNGDSRHECPLSATHKGLDGRLTDGHVDDYWIYYEQQGPDPWTLILPTPVEHTHGDCTGDFMKTNQWITPAPQNIDGGTKFFNFTNGDPMPAGYMETNNLNDQDGGYGLKLFYESRSYTVTNMYNQYIVGYNDNTKGFTYAQYCAEIDAGRPVMIHVVGHTMVGIGYDNTPDELMYIHDTWDYNTHTMTWGEEYAGRAQTGVTIVQLGGEINLPPELDPIGNNSIGEDQPLSLSITASDPNEDIIT